MQSCQSIPKLKGAKMDSSRSGRGHCCHLAWKITLSIEVMVLPELRREMLSIVQFYSTLQRVTRSSKCERPQRMESFARASNNSYTYIDSHRHIHAPLLPEQSSYAFVHRHEDACKCSQEASVAQSVCDHVRHWLCPGILLPT